MPDARVHVHVWLTYSRPRNVIGPGLTDRVQTVVTKKMSIKEMNASGRPLERGERTAAHPRARPDPSGAFSIR